MPKTPLILAIIVCVCSGALRLSASGPFTDDADAGKSPKATSAGREKLKPLNSLIGDWRGVGQLKRGSRRGAWTEKATCVWDFAAESPAVVISSDGGMQYQQLRLRWDDANAKLLLEQKTEAGVRKYYGDMPTAKLEKLVLLTDQDADDVTLRCTIQQLTDIRATILLEKRTSAEGTFRRIAEVGYTRSGARLAIAGGNQRKCIVTGGLGTIPVTHNGKTYYVCCQGCVQAFQDSPDDIVAEYLASLKKTPEK